jgi:hypothetical protein
MDVNDPLSVEQSPVRVGEARGITLPQPLRVWLRQAAHRDGPELLAVVEL